MAREQTKTIDLSAAPPSDRLSKNILAWLARTYGVLEEWKDKSRELFLATNGDSNLSRIRLAAVVRAYFLQTPPMAENVNRWTGGFEEVETVHMVPPKVSASNATYVDWLYIADYLLLGCSSPFEQFDAENRRRETEFQSVNDSYKIRLVVYKTREEMRRDSSLADGEVLSKVKKVYSNASLANIKEARRLQQAKVTHEMPKEPMPVRLIPRYTALYF